ncbi:hypothetical protein JMM81_20015 [Bacillus sp. V3B]|uniref:hypothetical protein n=1 Tax=Bacillus sp. V3B TaxID=2804915 RepID=UPI00210D49AE|nr:hypothetical protein [Bacillus sp. V3B]MCQ6277164.1 hypothetical protein [Bacillus sp. V3B]
MQFRHLLILGLMVGAVMFLPDNAFAEKNELSGQQDSQKASGHVNPSVGIDKAAVKPNVPATEKAVVVPDPAMKNQGEVKQYPAEVSTNKPAAASQNLPDQAKGNVQSILNKNEKTIKDRKPEKVPAAASQNLPDQAKGNVQSTLNKKVKAVKDRVSEKGSAAELGKNTPTPESGSGESTLDSLHNSEKEVKKQVQSVRFEPQGEDIHLSVAKKENRSDSLVEAPQEKGDVPLGEEEIPKVSQVLNPTQRTSGHGGQSNDRVSQGLSTISFLDKWFVWNPYYEIQFVQPYLSRHTWLNNQWVNAPPSPPPQEAPLLETVTRS